MNRKLETIKITFHIEGKVLKSIVTVDVLAVMSWSIIVFNLLDS